MTHNGQVALALAQVDSEIGKHDLAALGMVMTLARAHRAVAVAEKLEA